MLDRVPEPELMDTVQEAEAYDAMDHRAVNQAFVSDLLAFAPKAGVWLDLGTGSAQIPILVAQSHPEAVIVAADAALSMLSVARRNVLKAGFAHRIQLVQVDAKATTLPERHYTCIFSNSLVHHLEDPSQFWQQCRCLVAPGGFVFVRDLARPESEAQLDTLVKIYAEEATACQKELFAESLRSSYTVTEIAMQAQDAGLLGANVSMSSDRHWTLSWRA
jgi:ubiquinone/menaquinone biosynthesis C-methylase UbiE